MEEKDSFKKIGKKLPYEAPDGFFDQISDQTLQNARRRVLKKRKIRVLWLGSAVAASLTALAFFGYYLAENIPRDVVAGKTQSEISVQTAPEKIETATDELRKERKRTTEMHAVPRKELKPQPVHAEPGNEESVKDVLADLSDDELVEMVAMIQSDPFMEEVTE